MLLIPIGLLFIFYSLPLQALNGLDLLPDFVGYLLIALNLWRLRQDSYALSRGWVLCLFLAVYSLLVRFFAPTGLAALLLSGVELLAQLYLLQLLVDGVEDLEEAVDRHLNRDVLDRWRRIVSIFWIAVFVCLVGELFIPGIEFFGLVVAIGFMITGALLIITFLRTARRYRWIRRVGPIPEDPAEDGEDAPGDGEEE